MSALIFLKATIKKTIQVPGYYRKDGTYVPPHQKVVHYDPDKEVSHVLNGKGSHSQKKALKHAKKHVKDFDKLPADHKFAIVLSHATDIQNKASQAAAISGWKKRALAGKNPTAAQWKAFAELPESKQAQLIALVESEVKETSHLVPPDAVQLAIQIKEASGPSEEEKFLDALSKGEGKHYHLKAYKKLLADPGFKSLAPHAQADAVKIMAADMQKAASLSAAISTMKKRLLSGKQPTKAQLKAYSQLTEDKKDAFLQWAGKSNLLHAFWSAYKAYEKGGADKQGAAAPPDKPGKANAKVGSPFLPDAKAGDVLTRDQIAALPQGSVVELTASGEKKTAYIGEAADGQPVVFTEHAGAVEASTLDWVKLNFEITLKDVGYPGSLLPWQVEALKKRMPNGGGVMVLPHAIVSPHLVSPEQKAEGYVGLILNNGSHIVMRADEVGKIKDVSAWVLNGMFSPESGSINVYDGATIQKNGHTYVLKGGRWHRLDRDVPVNDPAEGASSAPASKKSAKGKKADEIPVADISDWEKVGNAKGSNPGGVYQAPNGAKFYAKFPGKADPRNELVASKLYEMAGLKVPTSGLVKRGKKTGIASLWMDGLEQASPDKLRKAEGVHDGFVVDAWLGNWDVIGTGYDNLLLNSKGEAVRVDPGGALLYRAQGEPKGDDFGPDVQELKSMLDSSVNPYAAKVFAGIDEEALLKGARRVALISPKAIDDLILKAGPGSIKERKTLAQVLKSRRAYILKHFGLPDPFAKGGKALPIFESDLPAPPDFENWQGKGKGLSSKPWVNAGNNAAVAHIRKVALGGDLRALEHLKVPLPDEEGHVKMVPVSEHPSSHVRQYYKDVLHAISGVGKGVEHIPPLGFITSADNLAKLTAFHAHGVTPEDEPGLKVGAYFLRLPAVTAELTLEEHYIDSKSAFVKQGYSWYEQLPGNMKHVIKMIQASGNINHVFSEKKPAKVYGGVMSPSALSKLMHEHAIELEAGMIIQRGMTVPSSAVEDILNLQPGDAFQNTDAMCCSYNKKHDWAGNLWLRITCADGSKALPTFGSGNYKKEYEVTTLPGARFVVKKKPKKYGGKIVLDLVMLPPDEDYLDTVEAAFQTGDLHKALVLVFYVEDTHVG